MNYLCYYLCCCCCCPHKWERRESKRERERRKTHNLKLLGNPEISKERPKVLDPKDVKTTEMSEYFELSDIKTEQKQLEELGYRVDKDCMDSGSFGTIHKAVIVANGLEIACKRISIPRSGQHLDGREEKKRTSALTDIKNELYTLQESRHPHVIQLKRHFIFEYKSQMTLYILMRLALGGNMSKHLIEFGPFTEEKCKHWFAQMLSAMVYMHRKGIAHRDLKLSNILLDESLDVLISDFGLSRLVVRHSQGKPTVLMSRTYCGTEPYMSPELISLPKHNNREYNALKVDVWALGVILFNLFNKEYPFPHKLRKAFIYMKQKKWRFSDKIQTKPTHGLEDIFNYIFEPNPELRPNMEELAKHKWIKDEFQTIEEKIRTEVV